MGIILPSYMDVSKNRGVSPKMDDGLYNGKPYFSMDDFGGKPPIFGKHPYVIHRLKK